MRIRLRHCLVLVSVVGIFAAACGGGDGEEPVDVSQTINEADAPSEADAAAVQADPTLPGADEPDDPAPVAIIEEPEPEPAVPAETYTVEAGDTLFDIADQFNTTVDEIVAFNNLADANTLNVGQLLQIPGTGEPDEALAEINDADPDAAAPDAADPDPADPIDPDPDAAADPPPPDPVDPPPPAPGVPPGTSPEGIPQPGPEVIVEEVPDQPANFSDYAVAALPWLQERGQVTDILDLFTTWVMPPVAGGDRLNLVDTDLDGLSSIVLVFTDPQTLGLPIAESNLAIYDPAPGQPDRYRLAYDFNLATGQEATNITVLQVVDMTGDGNRDITFIEQTCGVNTCTSSFHMLVRDGTGYRDAVQTPINIATAHSIDVVTDSTGDGVPDITVLGGTFATAGAEPQREFRWLFSGSGGTVTEVSMEGLPTDWMVWHLLDANSAFDQQDWSRAITLYNVVLTDPDQIEFAAFAGEANELRAFANLRKALGLAITGDSVGAQAAAQSLAGGTGLIAGFGGAFLTGIAGNDVGAACGEFNNALALRVNDWDAFWGNFGFAVPQVTAQSICPF